MAIWVMLEQNEPDGHVIATGETHWVKEFAEIFLVTWVLVILSI